MSYARIAGTGSYLPAKVMTNAELEQMVDTTDEWIVSRTGIRERHIAADDERTSELAEHAARQALDMAGLKAADIDLIIVATTTPDQVFPSVGCLLQDRLDIHNGGAAFDVQAACAGFVYAMDIANRFFRTEGAQRALVVGAETFTRIIDWNDRNTCILFGDGAGAVVVERIDEARGGIIDAINRVDGTGVRFLKMDAGGSLHPASHATVDEGQHNIYQAGRDVYKFAVKGMAGITAEIVEKNGYKGADVDLFVPHQANIRIIEAAQRRVGLEDSQVCITIDRFGNTTSASIPSALRVAYEEGRLKEGDLVVLCAFGAGFTWGSTLLRWTAP